MFWTIMIVALWLLTGTVYFFFTNVWLLSVLVTLNIMLFIFFLYFTRNGIETRLGWLQWIASFNLHHYRTFWKLQDLFDKLKSFYFDVLYLAYTVNKVLFRFISPFINFASTTFLYDFIEFCRRIFATISQRLAQNPRWHRFVLDFFLPFITILLYLIFFYYVCSTLYGYLYSWLHSYIMNDFFIDVDGVDVECSKKNDPDWSLDNVNEFDGSESDKSTTNSPNNEYACNSETNAVEADNPELRTNDTKFEHGPWRRRDRW